MTKAATNQSATNQPVNIETVEMHTGGEPLRIVRHGYPPIPGETILAKRRYARDNLDHLRRLLMLEPRGHFDMYGAILVEPNHPEADLAVLFIHNEGYSTMCGHAVMALGRYAVDYGLVEAVEPVTTVKIECPCGLVVASVEVEYGRSGAVSFLSVPAFAFATDQTVSVPGYGKVAFDIGYGGAFYALADAGQLGLDVRRSKTRDLVDAAVAISAIVHEASPLAHPDDADLAFLYGTILTDGRDDYSETATANICVFADRQVDRSPTGSGVTARVAVQHHKGQIAANQPRLFESVTGAHFQAEVAEATACGAHKAVRVKVTGKAHYLGECRFSLEEDDAIGRGFLLK